LRRLLAEVLIALGRVPEAVEHLRRAVQLQDPTAASAGARGVLCSLAGLALARGQLEAVAFLHAAAELRRSAGGLMLPRYERQRQWAEQALGAEPVKSLREQARTVDAAALRLRIDALLTD
jgi:hypothetical protein